MRCPGCHMVDIEVRLPPTADWDKGVAVGIRCSQYCAIWIWDSGLVEGDCKEGQYTSGVLRHSKFGPVWKRPAVGTSGQPAVTNCIRLLYDSKVCETSCWCNKALVFEGAKFLDQDKIKDDDQVSFVVMSEKADVVFAIIQA